MPRYSFVIIGSAVDDQTWTASGSVETPNEGSFMEAPQSAMVQAFQQLTGGKAIYGKPGLACRGPYKIQSMTLTRQEDGA